MLLDGPIIGTTAFATADLDQLRQAGVMALREGLPWPWTDKVNGTVSPSWHKTVDRLELLKREGFLVAAVTPVMGSLTRVEKEDGTFGTHWRSRVPEWMGEPGTEPFTENYAACCTFYGEQLSELVPMYQILNELDIPIFAGPLNLLQACELVTAAAKALRKADPKACLGINTAKSARSYYLYGRLYADDLLDYCGVDGYLGTWEDGEPQEWAEIIEELHAITGRPVFVNEWGYSSIGEVMSAEEAERDPWPCELKKWKYGWDAGHTPDVQAAFVREAMKAFQSCGDKFLGCLFYRWEDQEKCWQCGEPDCPAETAWGLVYRDGTPKPAFETFREGAQAIREALS